jgi:methyltransferase (TIGR00027 family)
LPKSEVARTALFVAAIRARENKRADRLFEDGLSSWLAGPEGTAWLAASEANPASNYHQDSFPYLEVRTRFFDEWVLEAVHGARAKQIVILGAGMDTRAFRLSWPPKLRLWEVDTPELFALKEPRLQSVGAKSKCERLAVEADLSSPDWLGSLIGRGFRKGSPTVWLAEGLFQYLPAKVVSRILEVAASVSGPGSRFGAEITSADYMLKPSKQSILKARKDRGTPWVFGTNDPDSLFGAHGWAVDAKVSALEEALVLGRWRASLVGAPDASFVSAANSRGRMRSRRNQP